ncbi:hypothetical protein CPB83DRAFT_864249 [Crepidotus variabilis]|uniref:Uncharacterized protein n=1 Tax=Crepidotus variabilis TaxID=179855 RepID=A0A9P6JJ01_9AGAR|nr:hypothetical protein CPB83DRAFT_864249 [Crepidotus variabilis]
MDVLCEQVFSSCLPPARERLQNVLSAVVVLQNPTIATLSDLLDIDASDVLAVLHSLGDIVGIEELPAIPPSVTEFPIATYLSPIVSFLDDSWSEFLTDKSRAGHLWVDHRLSHKMLQERADFLLSKSISPSPIPMHRSTWTAIFHSLAGLWTEYEDEIIRPWDKSWPLFTNELKTFQLADPTQQRLVTSNLLSLRTFRFLLRCCKEVRDDAFLSEEGANFRTAQSVVAAALRARFEDPSPASKGFFTVLSHLFRREMMLVWTDTVEEISKQPHLSWETVLGIVDHSHGFIDLDFGPLTSHELRVSVDWSLLDVIEDSKVIGQQFFDAYRDARINALQDTYEEFLNEEDPVLLQHKAEGLFRKPMIRKPLILIKPEIDESVTPLLLLLDRIYTAQSLAVLLSPDLTHLGRHSLFIPLVLFVILNCQEVIMIGPNIKTQNGMSQELIVLFIQNGVLAAAFGDPDYHDALEQRQLFMIYKTLCDFEGLHWGRWFYLADSATHTAIVEFFLGEYLVERLYDGEVTRVWVEWAHHFSGANSSSKIVQLLLFLRLTLQDGGPRIISVYAPLLSTGSFAAGVKIWTQKYVKQNSNDALTLYELCARLASIDWSTVVKYQPTGNSQDEQDTEGNSGEDGEEVKDAEV